MHFRKGFFLLLILLTATVGLTGCATGFTAEEQNVIHRGNRDIMRLATIHDYDDLVMLRQKARPATRKTVRSKDFETFRRRLLATVNDPDNEGVGIAAPQVSLSRRIIAVQRFDKDGEPFELYINPVIEDYSDSTAIGREGCLSIPGPYAQVRRSKRITLTYRDETFQPRTETIEGFTAVIFQHEVDHLNGILYLDRMEPGSLSYKKRK